MQTKWWTRGANVFENDSLKAKIEAPKNISCLALLRYFIVSPVFLRKFDQNVLGCCLHSCNFHYYGFDTDQKLPGEVYDS